MAGPKQRGRVAEHVYHKVGFGTSSKSLNTEAAKGTGPSSGPTHGRAQRKPRDNFTNFQRNAPDDGRVRKVCEKNKRKKGWGGKKAGLPSNVKPEKHIKLSTHKGQRWGSAREISGARGEGK